MSLVACPECQKNISDFAEACPFCGFPISKMNHSLVICKTCGNPIVADTNICPTCEYKTTHQSNFVQDATVSRDGVSSKYEVEFDSKKKKTKPFPKATIVIIFAIIFIFLTYLFHNQSTPTYEYGLLGINQDSDKITFEQIRTYINRDNIPDDQWEIAKILLERIPTESNDYREAQTLLAQKVNPKADEIVQKRKANEEAELKKRKAEEETELKEAEKALTPKAKRIRSKHPEWSIDDCEMIAKGEIRVGMTADKVIAAWGKPYQVNKTTTDNGIHEQWVMNSGLPSSYVYFENGVCTTIQN